MPEWFWIWHAILTGLLYALLRGVSAAAGEARWSFETEPISTAQITGFMIVLAATVFGLFLLAVWLLGRFFDWLRDAG